MLAKSRRLLLLHWPLLAATLYYSILSWPLITMQGVVVGSDGILYFYPAMDAFQQALTAGQLPHWTPNLQSGFPYLADGQPGVLYPFHLLGLMILPTPATYNLLMVVHGLLALVLTYAWGRCLKISPLAAALMGLLFVLTTPLYAENLPMSEVLAWTPALFLLAERSIQQKRLLSLWPIILVLAGQWLAGFPQLTVYAVLACSVYVAGRVLVEPFSWRERAGWAAAWLLVCLAGTVLAAPQLWPMYELSVFSIRAHGIAGAMAGEKSLFPLALLTFLLPTTQSFWQQASLGNGVYIGLIPFLVAVGAFFRRPKPRWFWPLVVMGLVTAVLAVGRYSPLFPLVREIPGLNSFRVPSRFLLMAQFGLITLFGWGWDQLWVMASQVANRWANRWMERVFKLAILFFVLASLVGYALLSWLKPQLTALAVNITFRYIVNDGYHLQTADYYLAKIEALYQNILNAMWVWPDTLWLLFTLVAGWLLVCQATRRPEVARWCAAGLLALVLLDVTLAVGGMRRVSPLDWVTTPSPTAALVRQEMGEDLCRLYTHTDAQAVLFQEDLLHLLPANYSHLWDIASTGLYSPLGLETYYDLLGDLGSVNLAFGWRPVTGAEIGENRALLNYLNVCVLTSREELANFVLAGQVNDVYIYRNEQALPRVFVVDEVVVVEAADVVTAVHENAALLPTTAILTTPLPKQLTPAAAAAAEVQVQAYEATFVAIQVDTPGDVLLQLTDTNYPGWQATLDGDPVEIVTSNAQFRAVLVPSGKHTITFTFAPHAFQQGVWGAAVGALFVMIWVLFWWGQKR